MMMRGGRSVQGFALGKVLDLWTVEDLDRLIKNKDVEVAAMGVGVAKSTDPSIQQDWTALSRAYQAARTSALKVMTDVRGWAITPDSLNGNQTTDAAFKSVIAALQPTPGQVTKGSKQDIANRLIAAGWKPTYVLPYPTQSDADLSIIKGADAIINSGKKGLSLLEWLEAHKTALIVGASVVGGVVVLGALSPYVKLLTAVVPHRRPG